MRSSFGIARAAKLDDAEGNVLSRPEQLPGLATVNTTTGGIWACTIRHHDGTFYVVTTLVKDYEPQTSQERWDNVGGIVNDVHP